MKRMTVAAMGLAMLVLGLEAGSFAAEGKGERRGAVAASQREWGGKMAYTRTFEVEKKNSDADKVVVQATDLHKMGIKYVANVKIVWGDLENEIKAGGKQNYSNWKGSLTIEGASGFVDQRIWFDDKTKTVKSMAYSAKKAAKADGTERPRRAHVAGPREGSGRDLVTVGFGNKIEWEAGVTGHIDGLRIMIESKEPTVKCVVKAGKFEIPLTLKLDGTEAETATKKK